MRTRVTALWYLLKALSLGYLRPHESLAEKEPSEKDGFHEVLLILTIPDAIGTCMLFNGQVISVKDWRNCRDPPSMARILSEPGFPVITAGHF